MKKKLGVILTTCLMSGAMLASVGLSGCAAKITEFVMPANGYDGSKVTITFANTTGQDLAAVVDAAIERFNELYPNITVKVDNNTKNWDDFADKVGTKITSGKQPNVAFCYSDHVASYNQAGAVVALDEFFLPGGRYEDIDTITVTDAKGNSQPLGLTQNQVKDYIKAFYADGSVYKDGHTYTLPFAKSTEVLFYNKTKFVEFGLVEKDEDGNPILDEKGKQIAKAPTTWKEMVEACEVITAKDKNCIALGYDSESNLFITLCEQYGLDYTSLESGDHYKFNTDEHKDFVKTLKEWYDSRYLTTQNTYGAYSSSLFTVTKSSDMKCYMSIGSTGGAQYQLPDATDGQFAFDIGVAPIPQLYSTDPTHPEYKEGYKPSTILQGPNVCIFKKPNPQEVVASWLLVKFLTTDNEFQGLYSQTSGYSPVTYSTFNSPVYQSFITKGSLMGKVAQVCYDYAEEDAFFTSPAFVGSSLARKQVGLILKTYLKGTEPDIDKAFSKAMQECSRFQR